jgi:O-antigen ligase
MGYISIKREIYILSLAGIALSLPLSVWLLSVFTIFLPAAWILNGGLAELKKLTWEKRSLLVFMGVWFVYLVWMLISENLSYGLKELRVKLPLLVLPIAIGLSDPLSRKELRFVLSAFISGVVISSAYGTCFSFNDLITANATPEKLSPLISHVRLAVMTVFAIAVSGWYFFSRKEKKGGSILYLLSGLWLTLFLFFLTTITGFFLMTVVIVVTLVKLFAESRHLAIRRIIVILLTAALVAGSLFIWNGIRSFYRGSNQNRHQLFDVTLNGIAYRHDLHRKDIENGNRVWINICEPEMRKEWDKKSKIAYDGKDKKGQEIRYTLIRYLASAGMNKDSAAISMLTPRDIINIENGMTNIQFAGWPALKIKLYEVIWQIDYYRNGGNPSGHSVTQRLEFWKTGWHVFLRFPWFGTGTGDIADEFRKQYSTDNSSLDINHRFLSHNQFLTFLASFGIAGFLLLSFFIFLPVVTSKTWRNYISEVFILIIFLSMLWEDTLHTHTGVSFFAYFYSLFIFGTDYYEKSNE